MKRSTVTVRDKYAEAAIIERFLKSRGIDVKVVTKHAVQIDPAYEAKTKEVLTEFAWDWERKADLVRQKENADRDVRSKSAPHIRP